MINKVILIGNLGKDPEVKYLQNSDAVCNFSVATTEKWKDKSTGEKREKTEWHSIVAWRRLAEICGEYLSKGSKVYVEGKLQTRSWEDKDGATRYKTEIVISEMKMLSDRGVSWTGNQGGGQGGGGYSAPPSSGPPTGQAPGGQMSYPGQGPTDMDIPF